MSDDDKGKKSSVEWGGLAKTILAGAAILVGVELVCPGAITNLLPSMGGTGAGAGAGLSKLFSDTAVLKGIGEVVKQVAGVVIAGLGLSYIFSDPSKNENAERHSERYNEARESFAIREDMRKMQTVMMARMKAAGHDPAQAAAGPQIG